jgi:hypothetical protein
VSWQIIRGRRYYYRNRKVAGRVLKEYVGAGPQAELAAALDAQRRQERRDKADARRAEQARRAPAEGALRGLDGGLGVLHKAALLAAGFHQHQGGEWRRKKDVRNL